MNTEQGQQKHRIDWVEPALYLSDSSKPVPSTLFQWLKVFPAVQVASPDACPKSLEGKVSWYRYTDEENRTGVWNKMAAAAKAPWVLFLQDDEKPDLSSIPGIQDISEDYWKPVLIRWRENGSMHQCYQIRLVSSAADNPFDGIGLPDGTGYLFRKKIRLGHQPVTIQRESDPFADLDTERELVSPRPSSQSFLVAGRRLVQQGDYVLAAAQFRKVLKTEKLLVCDRAAALNGLAGCKAEQFKWDRAAEFAEKSIRLQPRQWLPYLILFRIHQLGKRWQEAHDVLSEYHRMNKQVSGASFDRTLSETETLKQLADMSARAGNMEGAFSYYQKLYESDKPAVASDDSEASVKADSGNKLLERLLIFALELEKYDCSVHYYREMFGDIAPGEMDEQREELLFDCLGLFMRNGWYDFASARYKELVENEPENDVYMRRWLVALSKSKDIDKARSLLTGIRRRKRKAV